MDSFSKAGTWWLPGASPSRHGGVLTFGYGNEGLQLELYDALTIGPPEPGKSPYPEYPIVLGDTVDGERITLVDAKSQGVRNVTRLPEADTVFSERLRAGKVFVGRMFLSDGSAAPISSLVLEFELLDEWAWPGGFSKQLPPPDPQHRLFRFRVPEPVEFQAFGGTASICAGLETRPASRPEVILRRPVSLLLRFDEPQPYESLYASVVRPLQAFFTFACSAPTQLLGIRVQPVAQHVDGTSPVLKVAHHGWSAPSATTPDSWGMLLPMAVIESRITEVMGKWQQLVGDVGGALDLFADISLGPPHYAETRFLFAIQALEAYFRGHSGFDNKRWPTEEFHRRKKTMLSGIEDAETKQWAKESLRWGNELSQRERLRALVAYGRGAALRIIWPVDDFVETAVDTRNELTHRSGAQVPTTGSPLLRLTEQVMGLMEICLLVDLGLSDTEIINRTNQIRRTRLILESGRRL